MAVEGREWEGRGGGRIGTLAYRSGRRQGRFALPCQIKTKGWGRGDRLERDEGGGSWCGGRTGRAAEVWSGRADPLLGLVIFSGPCSYSSDSLPQNESMIRGLAEKSH